MDKIGIFLAGVITGIVGLATAAFYFDDDKKTTQAQNPKTEPSNQFIFVSIHETAKQKAEKIQETKNQEPETQKSQEAEQAEGAEAKNQETTNKENENTEAENESSPKPASK